MENCRDVETVVTMLGICAGLQVLTLATFFSGIVASSIIH